MGARKASELIHVRVTAEQRDQLRRLAKYKGVPITTYIQESVLARMERDEEGLRQKESERAARRRQNRPTGLGIRKSDDPPPAPTVDIDRLATYANGGKDDAEKGKRVEEVKRILAESATSSIEAQDLARAFEDRMRLRQRNGYGQGDAVPPWPSGAFGGAA